MAQTHDSAKPMEGSEIGITVFDLAAISAATNKLSKDNKLGQAGFGPVYKGVFRDWQEVAIRRLSVTPDWICVDEDKLPHAEKWRYVPATLQIKPVVTPDLNCSVGLFRKLYQFSSKGLL